jgi:hypothetical protein
MLSVRAERPPESVAAEWPERGAYLATIANLPKTSRMADLLRQKSHS